MKLREYEAEIKNLEANPPVDAPGNEGAARAMVGSLAHEIENIAWNIGYREEAKVLAARARRLQATLPV